MATSCLSRLLLIFLLGPINVVAHPMSKDRPTGSGNTVVQRTPCLKWKPKEEHQHNHMHHGNNTYTYQKITVKLDDKDGAKHKSDADEDEESTKTEYPSKASAKHGETKGTAHNHKDLKRSDRAVKLKLTDEEVDEMERLAHSYTLLNRKEKIKLEKMFKVYQHMKEEEEKLDKSKPGRVEEPKDDVLDEATKEKDYKAELDKLKKGEGYKPREPKDDVFVKAPKEKDYKAQLDNIEKYKDNKPKEPKYNIFDEARKQKDNKAQLDNIEKNEDYKPKDAKPWWALPTDKHDQAKHHRNELASTGEKGVEAKPKIGKRCVEFLPWWVQLIIKKVKKDKAKKKAKKEEEERKKLEEEGRLGGRNGKLSGSPPSFGPAVGLQKDSAYSKLKKIKEMEEKSPNALLRDKHKDWSEDKTNKAFDKKPSEENEPLNVGSKFNDDKPSSSALQQEKDKEDKQKSEVQPNKASGDSKDKDSNQSKNSLTRRFIHLPPRPYPGIKKRPESKEIVIEIRKRGQLSNVKFKQESEEQPNTASEDSKDEDSNQSKNSLTARYLPPPPNFFRNTWIEVNQRKIAKACQDFLAAMADRRNGQQYRITKAYDRLQQAMGCRSSNGQRRKTSWWGASAKSKDPNDIDDGHSNQSKSSLTARFFPPLPRPPSSVERERQRRLEKERRIQKAYENYIKALNSGNIPGLKKAEQELLRLIYPHLF
ncbi:hypothetical protein FPANT_10439 [Fusarium pseudoanthophilum]|uniref:Uncharacterized protein n=1 Tax=Fusarium pseudoanthophilum TaxID=48495 RepID=A0A8H5KSV2_9HYPO|nr:hypothetical protein FPANT_10439 [Fusarium pseudoanthophilum]